MTDTLTRRDFLGAVSTATAIGALPTHRADAQRTGPSARPNLLFILADDLGYGDLSCYGRPDYETPVLDGLAAQGIKLMSAYAAAPVCTPTRCAFVTGRYPQRLDVGLQEPLVLSSPPVGIPAGHPTIASVLRDGGYETALVGKWHLGWRPQFNPVRHGFDEFFGSLSGALDYFTHVAPDAGSAPNGEALPDLWENETRIVREGYLTDLYTERAVELIERPRSKPFYLSLHYTAPHSPWEGPTDRGGSHGEHGAGPMVEGGSLGVYAAMMQSMDSGIGRVLDALRRADLERNTLVIFTSDNGGERYSYQWPFSFQKMYLHEGGTRVPAIVRWPGVVPANRTSDQAAITMDWTATLLAAAGVQADPEYPIDGDDLMPHLTGQRAAYERALFWRTRARAAARVGEWKYLQDGEERLYDLSVDLGEKTDLKGRHPDVLERVRAEYESWAEQMLPRPA